MAFKHKGEFEIETGLGLPRHTTISRTAYVPSSDGYQVFDTDLKRVATYDTVNGWVIAADVTSKINTLDGVGVNSLTMQNSTEVDSFKIQVDPSSVFVSLTTELTAGELRLANTDGATQMVLADGKLTANAPIEGVDGVAPNSLVTKQYVDSTSFDQTFTAGNWVVGSPNTYTVLAATHMLAHNNGDSYSIEVQELIGGQYATVVVEASTNSTNGDVVISSVGAAFDGRIFISL